MKNKILMLMIVGQVAFLGVKAQSVGISYASGFSPLSTLDVNGSVGFTITGSNSTLAPATSTVLYNNVTAPTNTISLPNPASYINRIYIITNSNMTTAGVTPTAWGITANTVTPNAAFYYNLSHVSTSAVPVNIGIMIISDGINWLQIR